MKPITFQYACPECGEKMSVKFWPGRPAPACSNPDSPSFSDPGDPEEVECEHEYCPKCSDEITENALIEAGYQAAEWQKDVADEQRAEAQAEHLAELRTMDSYDYHFEGRGME